MQITQNESAAERASGKEKTAGGKRDNAEAGPGNGGRGKVRKEGRKWMVENESGSLCVCVRVCVFMVDRKKEEEGVGWGGGGGSPAMAGRGMPGPGTGERDGGWSMLTSPLPTEHIPTTESWRLFNLQILKLRESFPAALHKRKRNAAPVKSWS